MNEQAAREGLVKWGKSLFERGLTAGSSGNLSVRLDDGYLFTPTNSCLGFLETGRLSKLDIDGKLVSGDPPTKELPLHFGFYAARIVDDMRDRGGGNACLERDILDRGHGFSNCRRGT